MKYSTLYRFAAISFIFIALFITNEKQAFYYLDQFFAEQRMSFRAYPSSGKIALLEIDNKSLTSIGLWPWKRSIYGEIVQKSFAAGATELAFDIDFSSSSSPEEDAAFEKALKMAEGPVTLAVFQQFTSSNKDNAALATNQPIEQLQANAWMATVNVLADPDGVIRQFPYAQIIEDETVSSLAGVFGEKMSVQTDTFLVDFGIDPETIPTFSVIDLLEGKLPPDALKGRKVLIGAGAAELRDTLAVPVYGMLPGPKLQILAADNILQGRDLSFTPPQWQYYLSLLVFLAILLISQIKTINTYVKIGLLVATAILVEATGLWLYINDPLILPTGMIFTQITAAAIVIVIFEIRFKDLLLNLTLRRSDHITALLQTIVEDSFSGILIVTEKGKILEISQQAQDMLNGLGYDARKDQAFDRAMPPEMAHILRECLDNPSLFDRSRTLKTLTIRQGEEDRYYEYSITPSLITSGQFEYQHDRNVATILFHDVTEAKRDQLHLAYLADHDSLTGLYNEESFYTHADEAMEQAMSNDALIFACQARRIDKINQSLGSQYADLLLQQIGERLSALEEFDLVGCSGQREFMLCALGARHDDAKRLGARIAQCLDEPFALRGHNVIAGSFVGAADFNQGGKLAEEVFKAATVALQRSKEDGHNCLFYTSDLAADVLHRRVLEREIMDALNRNEFEMHYQPQVDLKTGEIVSCEALIRWHHRDLGFIRPDLFIPIMEETGGIVELGRWIMETACKDAMSWAKPISVAVNVSAIQFNRSDVVADINHALEISGLPRDRLHVEITESLFIADPQAIIGKLNAIRAEGIKIALDDFGTGYSSLSYIHQFPLDKIKIDQAFVKDLPNSVDSMAVINAVMALARGFDMDIVAEGIETKEQAEILRITGCHIGQGWHFGKAMPSKALNACLKASGDTVPEEARDYLIA